MNTPPPPPPPPPAAPSRSQRLRRSWQGSGRVPLRRDPDDRIIAGVCAGVARQVGVDPLVVRVATVAFAFAGGVGIVLYLLGWTVSEEGESDVAVPITRRQTVAVGLIALGTLLLLRDIGLWLGDTLVLPVVLGAIGSAIIWARADDDDRQRWSSLSTRFPGRTRDSGGRSPVRILAGVVLIAIGMTAILATNNALLALRSVGLAIAATLAGAALVLGPWVARLVSELTEERRERIRSEERAEVAAHLHDSVLQTLALIQRNAADAPTVSRLARSQERDLRAWLFESTPDGERTLAGALRQVVREIEDAWGVDIELVTVGEAALDEGLAPLVAATREAATNAAKHAGTSVVDVYAEASSSQVEVFVRDRGAGFDPDRIPADRQGIRASIIDRMARHDGSAEIRSTPGGGTEVRLRLPRTPSRQESPS
ncbi:MAG: ATP-binding protein [Nocardioides sp.]